MPAHGSAKWAPADESGQDHAQTDLTMPVAEEQIAKSAQVPEATKLKSQVPMWRDGLA